MTGYLDEVIRPLVLISPKMSGYVETFRDKDRHKDDNRSNNLMSFCIDDEKLLEKFGLMLKICKYWAECSIIMVDV